MNEEQKVLTGLTAHWFTSISPERIRVEVPDLQPFAAPPPGSRLSLPRGGATIRFVFRCFLRAVQATNLGRPFFVFGGEFTWLVPFSVTCADCGPAG
jgi:hypothetical protein